MKNREQNHHHLCPKSQGGTSIPENIKIMEIVKHQALHCLFLNRLPHQQFSRLSEINGTVFTEEYSRSVRELLQIDDPRYIYKD